MIRLGKCLLTLTVAVAFTALLASAKSNVGSSATQPAMLSAKDFDFPELLGQPPANDSAVHQRELKTVLKLQEGRTKEDAERCKIEAKSDVFIFADVLGPSFNAEKLPKTAELMSEVEDNTKHIVDKAKDIWNRPRPFIDDPRVHPAVKTDKEKDGGFPSGHSARGMVWATLLAEIFPEQKEALIKRGEKFGDDRVLAGAHYPTDVAAGRVLGAEIARRLLADPDFQQKFEAVRAECAAPQSIAAQK